MNELAREFLTILGAGEGAFEESWLVHVP